VLYGSNGNSYTVCIQADVCTHCAQYEDAGRKKRKKKMGQQWMPRAKEMFPRAILGKRATGSQPCTTVKWCCICESLLASVRSEIPRHIKHALYCTQYRNSMSVTGKLLVARAWVRAETGMRMHRQMFSVRSKMFHSAWSYECILGRVNVCGSSTTPLGRAEVSLVATTPCRLQLATVKRVVGKPSRISKSVW